MSQVILASTSIYRTALLKKTGISFSNIKPTVDEEQLKQELLLKKSTPKTIAESLSIAKGASLATQYPESIIISGDQLVDFQGEIIGKSHNYENAFAQLKRMNDQSFNLLTATTITYKNQKFQDLNTTHFKMRNLSDREIQEYIKVDQPFDCAGSCKIEEHGIVLFEKIECTDFTAIQGLPLIWVTTTLKELGHELFKK